MEFVGAVRAHFVAAWKLALRSRSFQAVFALAFCLLLAAYLGAAFSARQPLVVALDLGLSGLRIGLLLLNLFWIHELVSKEIDRRSILLHLSFPVPRAVFVIGRYLAIQALSLLAAVTLAIVLRISVQFASWGYDASSAPLLSVGFWSAVIMLWFEVAVVSSFALAVAVVSSTLFFPMLVGFLFALAGRMIGPVLDYLLSGAEGDTALVGGFLPWLNRIRWALPDLSALDIRAWPLYGVVPEPHVWGSAFLASAAYGLVAFLAAISLFDRRRFV